MSPICLNFAVQSINFVFIPQIPATLFFVLSLFFWAAFSNFWPDHIHPSAYPLAWLVFTLALLLNPFNFFYASSRWWMARSMMRVFSSGIVAVRFRDFFLGDELNSLYFSVSPFPRPPSYELQLTFPVVTRSTI